ncbi:hypothetical protein Y1Q_0021111 [Alligator mississippiensis]|uniref:Uncharacterized protein n=1 Tax=Alligator mississippiensis TaxID=8496 RepID=A0A151NS77_ALLMI|nr:hypothetical protein Y1Q_0021111 [Alligator mississippiensis]
MTRSTWGTNTVKVPGCRPKQGTETLFLQSFYLLTNSKKSEDGTADNKDKSSLFWEPFMVFQWLLCEIHFIQQNSCV